MCMQNATSAKLVMLIGSRWPEIMNLVVMAWRLFPSRSLHEPCARLLGRLQNLGACISARRGLAAAAAMATGR